MRYFIGQAVWVLHSQLGWIAGEIVRVRFPDHYGATLYTVETTAAGTWTVTEDDLDRR